MIQNVRQLAQLCQLSHRNPINFPLGIIADKMCIRDRVIRYLQPQLAQSHSIDESRQIIQNNLPQIKQTAEQKLQELHSSYSVTLQYGHFDFPVKYYGSFSLPAGNYEALRIRCV